MFSINETEMPETQQTFNILKKLCKEEVQLFQDIPRHNFLADFARITLATWSNLTLTYKYSPVDAFAVVGYNLSPYVIDIAGMMQPGLTQEQIDDLKAQGYTEEEIE